MSLQSEPLVDDVILNVTNLTRVYRYVHPMKGDHLYTTDSTEIGTTQTGLYGNHGYISEGVAFMIFLHHQEGLVPVYRYYNENDHFYTTNSEEIGTITPGQKGHHHYTCEGILGYISPKEFTGSVQVYRYYNASNGDHFYTVNCSEIGLLNPREVGNHSYTDESILGYALPPDHNVTPVYRYYNEKMKDHFYTTWPGEIGTIAHGATGKHGFKSEGCSFYIFAHHTEGLLPLYRYFNGGDHFYTNRVDEIGTTKIGAVGNHGFKCEGILGYVSPTQFNESIPIYRYFHPKVGDHFYTTLESEIGTIQNGKAGNHGYIFEGVTGYIPKP